MNAEVKPVSFRLKKSLVERLRVAAEREHWPRLSQTALVERGIELVLQELRDKDDAARRVNRK